MRVHELAQRYCCEFAVAIAVTPAAGKLNQRAVSKARAVCNLTQVHARAHHVNAKVFADSLTRHFHSYSPFA